MVKHVLEDGKVLKDIAGHLVTRKDAPRLYDLLEKTRGENYGGNNRGIDGRSNEGNRVG